MKPKAKAAPPAERTLRDRMMPEAFYQSLDLGIRFAVRVLHASGCCETCQSCEGGKGHAYDCPTVDILARAEDAVGFAAVAALHEFGLPIRDVSIVWNLRHGLPYEKLWRVTFWTTMEDRADEQPNFVWSYEANEERIVTMSKRGDL